MTDEEIEELKIENEKLKLFIKGLFPDKFPETPFICGVGGEKDRVGLHEFIHVCPAYGASGVAMYKKHIEYSEPGW